MNLRRWAIPALLLVGLPAGAREPDLLFIALDAVPYEAIEAVRHPEPGVEPLFAELAGPTRLVSSFRPRPVSPSGRS
ncbi:MAG: hypothetical protein R2991_08275 [Thermoanaerobaculia bacterium]